MKLLHALLIFCAVGVVVVGGAYRVFLAFEYPELRLTRIELKAAELARLTEQEKQRTERERRETLREMARLERQTRLESSAAVSLAAVTLAAFLRLFPVLIAAAAAVGGLVYALTRRVRIESPICGEFPRKDAFALASMALQVQYAEAAGKVAAFSEDTARRRLNDFATLGKAFLRSGLQTQAAAALTAGNDAPTLQAGNVTFQQAVKDFRQGSVLVGYGPTRQPVYFALDDFVSAAVGGCSGSGKSSKLRFLVAQLILQGVNVSLLDAHAGNEQSLADSLGNLVNLPNVRLFNPFETADAVETMLSDVQQAIDAGKPADVPCVFILDEIRPLNKRCSDVETLMDKLANEGRKFNQFGVFSSQTWEASMFKQAGSAARDACVLKLSARMPKKQAHILFADNEAAKTVSRLQQPEMFADSMKFSGVVDVPFCSRTDLDALVSKTHSRNLQAARGEEITPQPIEETRETFDASENVLHVPVSNVIPFPNVKRRETPTERRETVETEIMQETVETLSDDAIRDALNVKLETPGTSLSGIAAEIGVNKGVLHKFLRNGETPSETTRACCMAFLRHETAIRKA